MPEFDLEKALAAAKERQTADDLARQDEATQELRKAIASTNDANVRLARAKEHETAVLTQIAMLTQLPESELKQSRLRTALDRLSEVVAEQGRYAEAASITPNFACREEYLLKDKALCDAAAGESAKRCDCADDVIESANGRTLIDPIQHVEDVYSPERNAVVPLMRCGKCGFLNLPYELT